jgi:serine/threonine protein kinase
VKICCWQIKWRDFIDRSYALVAQGDLPDGQEVAVKRLFQSTKQGLGQMRNELTLLVKLQHKNLVRIVGVCLEDGEHMLVYEYMPNKSLDTIIFGTACPPLIPYKYLKVG